jgi:N-acetylglucosaminyl-diphospho-decaprenol L-rhamnosyltransferase
MTLSVTIVTHNSAGVLRACWRSVRCSMPGAEIIVVDNASTDDTKLVCEELDGVKLIANAVNEGYGRACNRGAASANGSHVLFVNPDVEIGAVDLTALRSEAARAPFGLVAPMLKHGTHPVPHWPADLVRHVTGPLRPRELPAFPKPPHRGDRWWPAGALLLVDRQEFLDLGGFDPRFFLYYEDLDLARRYRAAGLPVRVTRSVRALHARGMSSAESGSGAAARQGWSYLSWIEYLLIWYGPDTAQRAARYARRLRCSVNHTLGLLERARPIARRAARKRLELAEIEAFVRWQCSFGPGTAADDFCPQAREMLSAP